jgi:hypothetical protein
MQLVVPLPARVSPVLPDHRQLCLARSRAWCSAKPASQRTRRPRPISPPTYQPPHPSNTNALFPPPPSKVAEEKAKDQGRDDGGGSASSASVSEVSEIDTLVLVDRTVDWVSPLVTSLTCVLILRVCLCVFALWLRVCVCDCPSVRLSLVCCSGSRNR